MSEDLENISLVDSSSFPRLLADPSPLQNSLANKKIISPSLPMPTSICSLAPPLLPCVEFAPPTPSCLLHDKMNFSSDPSTFQAMMLAWCHLSNILVSISPINLTAVCPLFHATFPSTMASNAHSLGSSPSLVLDSTSSPISFISSITEILLAPPNSLNSQDEDAHVFAEACLVPIQHVLALPKPSTTNFIDSLSPNFNQSFIGNMLDSSAALSLAKDAASLGSFEQPQLHPVSAPLMLVSSPLHSPSPLALLLMVPWTSLG